MSTYHSYTAWFPRPHWVAHNRLKLQLQTAQSSPGLLDGVPTYLDKNLHTCTQIKINTKILLKRTLRHLIAIKPMEYFRAKKN